jgi:GcrA cell cycle regulator
MMTDAGAAWTDERVELLKRLWSEGLSASQIAAQIGGVTRNAVIGKVHRLGLSGRAKASSPAAQQRPRKPAPRPPSHPLQRGSISQNGAAETDIAAEGPALLPEPIVELPDEIAIPMSQRVTMMELRESMCRWPMGDPTSAEFRFCGARAVTALPYCAHHARIAYQPAAERRRGDRRIALRA